MACVLSDASLSTGERLQSFRDLVSIFGPSEAEALSRARSSGRLVEGNFSLPDSVAACLASEFDSEAAITATFIPGWTDKQFGTGAFFELGAIVDGAPDFSEEIVLSSATSPAIVRLRLDEPLLFLRAREESVVRLTQVEPHIAIEIGPDFVYAF